MLQGQFSWRSGFVRGVVKGSWLGKEARGFVVGRVVGKGGGLRESG